MREDNVMEYGIQMYSIRDMAEKDLDAALGAVATIGYKYVEFAGFFGHTAEEVKALSADEVMDKIKSALYQNEHADQLESGVKFHGTRYAEGLERLLYRCPKCGAEFAITSKGDTLTCSNCKNTVRYSKKGGLHPVGDSVCPERIDTWFDLEREVVAEEVKAENFALDYPVHLFIENEAGDGYRFVTSGDLHLDKEVVSFKSNMTDRPVKVDTVYKIGDYGTHL